MHLRHIPLAALLVTMPHLLGAQDSTPHHDVTQRAWINLGAGLTSLIGPDPRTPNNLAFAGVLSASYSPGPLVFETRSAGAAEFLGDYVHDWSVLVGMRSTDPSTFVSATFGIANAQFVHQSDGGGFSSPKESSLAYEFGAGGHGALAGIGFTLFGVAGPKLVRYTALGLSIQLGKLR